MQKSFRMEQILFVDLRLDSWEVSLVLCKTMIPTIYFDRTIDNLCNPISSSIFYKTNVKKGMVGLSIFINKNTEKLLNFIL